jgi:hypothetical protein
MSADAKLTRFDGTIHTDHDGQVIENLDIYSGTTGIDVAHDNVVIRNVRIHHAEGDGVSGNGAANLRIENAEIINSGPPNGQSPETNSGNNNIELTNSPHATIDGVSLHDGSSGIYLAQSPGAQIDHVDGYNFHGPFPRGQLVQFNASSDSSLTNFYVHNDPNNSFVEDNVNVFESRNVHIENGVIDGNNSVSGVGVMFEGDSGGGSVKNVDAIHQGNGGFFSYSPNVSFSDIRTFDSFNADQGRGPPSSEGLQFGFVNSGVSMDDATFTRPGNPGNIAWDLSQAAHADIKEDPSAVPMPHDAYVNDWHWMT